jgi:hypothetical protein
MEKSPQPLEISSQTLELLERRLADKVQERVLHSVKRAGLLLGTLLTVLSAFGLKELYAGISLVERQREEARKLEQEIQASKELLQREVVGFRETVLPEFRVQMKRWANLERRVAYSEACERPLAVEADIPWFVNRFGRTMTAFELESFGEYFERYHVCHQEQLDEVLDHTSQEMVQEIYRRVLDRQPDPFGRFVWGIRLMRGYTYDEVRAEIANSSEARAKEQQE